MKIIKNVANKFFALLFGLSDLKYLSIQILNTLKGGQPLSKGYYNFFDVFFNKINKGVGSNTYCIYDVGANDGWFARVMLRFIPEAEIISFEPLKSQKQSLEEIKNKNKNFNFHPFALGSENCTVEINEYGTNGLSSILNFAENQYDYNIRNFDTTIVASYSVECFRLDSLDYLTSGKENKVKILKIDTQGFEMNIIQGASKLFEDKFFDYVIVEVLTIEKYSGGPLYFDIINLMTTFGYNLCELFPSCREKNGWVTEFDVIFSKHQFSENYRNYVSK